MSPRLKKILFASLLIVTVVLAFSAWLLQKQMVDAQTQTNEAQSQLTNNQNLADQTMYYGNLSESLQSQLNSSQTQISNLQNLTDKLQNQINNLQTQLNNSQAPAYNVTVTAITWGSWTNPVGVGFAKTFNVTIKNVGTANIGGITSAFKIVTEGRDVSDKFEISIYEPQQMGVLHIQESGTITAIVTTALNVPVDLSKSDFVATIMLDEVVLDESTAPLGTFFGN
jgi:hypothetical protein